MDAHDAIMPVPRLTYCGNLHPAADLQSWCAAQSQYAGPLATAQRAAGHGFGLGAWFDLPLLAQLEHQPTALEQLRAFLSEQCLEIWTCDAFPIGDFHAEVVKDAAYQPDWQSEERLLYTRQVAELACEFCPEGETLPISTLPLGYRQGDLRLMARNLVRAASHLQGLEQATGREVVLCLEPEPFCLLETCAQAIEFFEEWVFRTGAWTVPEEILRRHLGVCIDLCHLAVLREDPLKAARELARHGIRVAKIQVSSCLELRAPELGLDQLLGFDEPRYLHQCVAESGARALDLPELAARQKEFLAAGRLRCHFHLPVFWDSGGPLGSTRAELERVLPELPGPLPLLEIETYTWEVLDADFLPDRDLLSGLEREFGFVRGLMDRRLH